MGMMLSEEEIDAFMVEAVEVWEPEPVWYQNYSLYISGQKWQVGLWWLFQDADPVLISLASSHSCSQINMLDPTLEIWKYVMESPGMDGYRFYIHAANKIAMVFICNWLQFTFPSNEYNHWFEVQYQTNYVSFLPSRLDVCRLSPSMSPQVEPATRYLCGNWSNLA